MQPAIAEPPALLRQLAQPRPERGVVGPPAAIADRAPVRGDDAARPPLAHLEARLEMRDRLPPGGGRYHFFARAPSAGVVEHRSARAASACAFSASSAFSRFASETSIPPNLAFQS